MSPEKFCKGEKVFKQRVFPYRSCFSRRKAAKGDWVGRAKKKKTGTGASFKKLGTPNGGKERKSDGIGVGHEERKKQGHLITPEKKKDALPLSRR